MNGCILILPLIVSVMAIFVFYISHRRILRERRNYERSFLEKERELRKYHEDLKFLQSFLKGLRSIGITTRVSPDIRELCQIIIEKVTKLMKTEIGSLMLLNPETNLLEIYGSVGLDEEIVRTTKLKIGEGIAGRVFLEGEPIFCADIEKDPRFMRKANVKYYSKSFISVPLRVGDRVIGVLNVNNKEKMQEFNQTDLELLAIVADEVAAIIENTRLYSRMREMYIGTIKALAHALEARDPYYQGHSERVARYSVEIARKLGLPQEQIENVRRAALIHDIGKIGVPDTILLKPDQLTKKEWEIIREHPEIGEELIKPIDFLENLSPMIRSHHERWDGLGYPDGLKGEEIPIGARIIAIADAYDSMTSSRPYREALNKEKAIEELKKEKGRQFDPHLVDVFLEVLKEEVER
ncbi:MAG: phosphohydrolase [Caldiserica bacterium]|nr:MAG: phosphohydrolase [Caldisericota bacterium]